ncbi:twitching motility protein PilT [Candidatus Acidianus copahuensis]|uniref:Twitching motility protein PilT n=1 Tax=Candidatus Acidianus copahuensis TaxID=1160895 RepID=A0A031LRV7_9CREN|nr:type II toxin-antitoxin system VapC family toxin [Candidatus Acidianus copahuensis]EZQ10224.1 twitching motility protein PilT [Candidatus Acidianus copahuensis]
MECKCLDTDMLIDFLRGKKEAVNYIEKNKGFSLKTTVVNLFELYYGSFLRGKGKEEVDALKDALDILEFRYPEEAGKEFAELSKNGEIIDVRDLLIGVIARENGCTIVTGNAKHFSRINGLKVENYKEIR